MSPPKLPAGKLPPKKAPPSHGPGASSASVPGGPAAKHGQAGAAPAASTKAPASKAAPAAPAHPASAPSSANPAAPKRPMPEASQADLALIRSLPENLSQMIEAVSIYDALLTEENAMLEANDAHGVAAMLDRKIAATQLYQDRLRAVLADASSTRALEPKQREKVIILVKAMEEKARKNAVLLQANMHAIEQVIDAVNLAARKMKRHEVGYSEGGKILETYGPSGSSMALNSTV